MILGWKVTFGTLGTKYWLFGTVCGVQSYFTVYLRKHAHCSVSSWAWRKSSFTLHAFLLIKGRIVFIPTVISAVGVYLERDRESRSIWNSQISLSLSYLCTYLRIYVVSWQLRLQQSNTLNRTRAFRRTSLTKMRRIAKKNAHRNSKKVQIR